MLIINSLNEDSTHRLVVTIQGSVFTREGSIPPWGNLFLFKKKNILFMPCKKKEKLVSLVTSPLPKLQKNKAKHFKRGQKNTVWGWHLWKKREWSCYALKAQGKNYPAIEKKKYRSWRSTWKLIWRRIQRTHGRKKNEFICSRLNA